MATGMETVIEAPALRRRPWGLLIEEAFEIDVPDDKIAAGVTFTPMGCAPVREGTIQFCIDDEDNESSDDDIDSGECPVFDAFHVAISESATTLDWDQEVIEGRLTTRFAAIVSSGVARHLMEAPEGSFFSDATILTDPDEGIEAAQLIAKLEQHLASVLHGAQGMIHLAPSALALVEGKLQLVDGTWYSPGGHIVVADAGYADQAPETGGEAENVGWAYASGMVGVKVGPPDFRNPSEVERLDYSRNELHGRRIARAVVAYEPCAVGAVQFRYSESALAEGS